MPCEFIIEQSAKRVRKNYKYLDIVNETYRNRTVNYLWLLGREFMHLHLDLDFLGL